MNALLERIAGVRWLAPGWLLLALLLPPALALAWRAPSLALRFAPAALFRQGSRARAEAHGAFPPSSWRTRLRFLPLLLEGFGLLALVVALARPAARVPLPQRTVGVDILLCIDTSSSMTASDLDPGRTRLEVARDAAAAFLRGRPDDRVGLVTFARYPDLLCPPTRDHEALAAILSGVTTVPSDGPEDATGLGAAVARAAEVLGLSRGASRVVILLTDGEENVALTGLKGEIAPAHAAQLCERLGVKVYTIVVGEGRRDASGTWVALDTRTVAALAARTGGAFEAAPDADALAAVYARIDALEKAPFEEPRFALEDRLLGLLLAALVLFLAGRVLAASVWDVLP